MGLRTRLASEGEREKRGECELEIEIEIESAGSDSSLSRTDLQEETRWECFLQAAFLTILSRQGPKARPQLEGPPRFCEADILVIKSDDDVLYSFIHSFERCRSRSNTTATTCFRCRERDI